MNFSPLIKKYNRFELIAETAFSHYANGGFREGSPIKIKPAFFSSEYFKRYYSGSGEFAEWLKNESKRGALFFIHRVVSIGPGQDIKNSNDTGGAGDIYLEVKPDPRVVRWPTEYNRITIPADYRYLEVWSDPINLPPLDAIRVDPAPYEPPKVYVNDNKLGQNPTDDELPVKNKKLPHSNKWNDKKPGGRDVGTKY